MTESLDLDALEAVARASVAACEDDWYEVGSYTLSAPTISPVDRGFIAAFSPAVAAALIGRVREAEAAIAGSPEKGKRLASLVASSTRLVRIERDDARARADAAEAVIERVRALLDAPSDERGITWWSWIDGGLGGSLYADLRAALGGDQS